MSLPYGHTNLLVAVLLLGEAALLVEGEAPTEIDMKVCDLLVQKAKEQLG